MKKEMNTLGNSKKPIEGHFSTDNHSKHLEEVNNKLREHILLRDSVERAMADEFKSQIAHKNEMIKKLIAVQAIASNSGIDEGQLILLKQRNSDLEMLNNQLKESLTAEKSAIVLENKREVTALKLKIAELERTKHIQTVDDDSSKPELTSLRHRVAHLEALNNKLREHLLLRDSVERAMAEEFKAQISEKEEAVARLMGLHSNSESKETGIKSIEEELNSELFSTRKELQEAQQSLIEKKTEIANIKGHFKEKEQAYEELQKQQNEQLREKEYEIGRIKAFLAEREETTQQMEEQLTRALAEKDSQLNGLIQQRKIHGNAIALERQLDQAKQALTIKDATSKRFYVELAKAKEGNSILQRTIESERAHSEALKEQYEKIINTIKKDSEKLVKSIIEDYSSREAVVRTENERMKMQLAEKDSELQIQKQKIDSAIKEFSLRSQQIISLRDHTATTETIELAAQDTLRINNNEELETYTRKARQLRDELNKKETEMARKEADLRQKESEMRVRETETKNLLNIAEMRIKDIEGKQDSMDIKEQILLRQQEAFNKGLETLEKAGKEIKIPQESELEQHVKKKEKEEVKPNIQSIEYTAVQETKEPEKISIENVTEQPIQQPEIPVKAQEQMPIKTQDQINLQEQTLGYPEVEEIMSIIDVAIQNKDTLEKIKSSLIASGYSSENVEKAVRKMKLT